MKMESVPASGMVLVESRFRLLNPFSTIRVISTAVDLSTVPFLNEREVICEFPLIAVNSSSFEMSLKIVGEFL